MDSLTLEGPGLGAGLWTGSLAQFPLTLWPHRPLVPPTAGPARPRSPGAGAGALAEGRVEGRSPAGPSLPRPADGKPFGALSRLTRARRPKPQGRHRRPPCTSTRLGCGDVLSPGPGATWREFHHLGLWLTGPSIGSDLAPETHVSPPLGPLPSSEVIVTQVLLSSCF